ncbi:MAG: pyruvate formate lyase family protein [Acutalibacteraceae bacterium]|nr:pyruvate formate lyase family protein [Acutalibacteraceae bacterium]
MSLISKADRAHIENKYHLTDKPFNAHERFSYHGYDYDETTGLNDEEMAIRLKEVADELEAKGTLPAVNKARGFECVLDNTRIDVNGYDYFVGFYSWGRPIDNQFIWRPYENIVSKKYNIDYNRHSRIMNDSGTAAMWIDFDHVVPDWDAVLSLGFKGLRDRAREYRKMNEAKAPLTDKQKDFYDSIEIEYNAILRIIDRFIEYADTHKTEKNEEISACLRSIRNGAPQNTYEALQVIYLYFMFCESVDRYQTRSLGHGLDYSLYPFFKKDIENGTYTVEKIRTFLAHFLMQFSAIGNYWGQPFWLGGTDVNGKTLVNELSYIILDVYDELNIYNPKIQIKYNYNTPVDFTEKVLRVIRSGKTCFLFAFEPSIVKSLMSNMGATYEEAITCDISGCSEMHIRHNETCMGTGYINAAKAMSYVFTNGYDTVTNRQIGLQTGDVAEMKTFEEFYAAFLKQWAYLIDTVIDISKGYEPYVDEINPAVMHSATMECSLTSMLDGYSKAPKYNTSSLLNCAFGTAVDSVLAVKELVFNTKETTLAELKDALSKNWEGYEKLRAKALNCRLKYGNGMEEADRYAFAMSSWYATYVTGRPNGRGGFYKADMHSALQFVIQGKKTEATPDGRKFGDEYSKNGSPVVGMDREGITALLKSVASAEPTRYSVSYVLDAMLHPSAVQGEDGIKAMKAILDTYMKLGGVSIQFNIFDANMLKDAQKNPDKYKNLQVRVSGWNVLWNNLSKEEQDAYILRAENIKQ